MYRVELKGWGVSQPPAGRSITVPNAPCGVERVLSQGLFALRLCIVPNAPCGVESSPLSFGNGLI